MQIGTYTPFRIVCILTLAASFALTGCKTGAWKMPKFSWNRDPSATTLAGNETPKFPESPANKYTPSTIASVGAGTSNGTSSGNKATSNGYTGQASSTATQPTAGMAANANGYKTGAYTFGQKSDTTGSQSNSNITGNVATGPNPYGGSYAGMNSTKQVDQTAQNGVKSALTNYPGNYSTPSVPTGYGAVPQSSGSAYGGTSSPPVTNYPLTNANNSTAPNTYTSAPYPNQSLPAIPSPGTIVTGVGQPNSQPTGQAQQFGVPNYPGTIPMDPTQGQPSSGFATTNQSISEPTSNRYSGVYQPGTTARPTTYNFGNVAPAQATTPSTPTLPPNTAANPPTGVLR